MPASRVVSVGIDHRTADVSLRERLAVDLPHRCRAAFAEPAPRRRVAELAWLSTCNRVELYAVLAGDEPPGVVIELLRAGSDIEIERLRAQVRVHHGLDAARHLFRVAAGLESRVLGEPQILGQVADAHRCAIEEGTIGPVLDTVFRRAVRAGRRARRETGIGDKPASVSSVAVALAAGAADPLCDRRVLVVGAGEMATAAIFALQSRGACRVTVMSRTRTRAEKLARRFGCIARPLADLAQVLAEADVVLSATGSTETVVDSVMVSDAVRRRGGSPVVLVDIAVPRDIDPRVRGIPGVCLFDADDLHGGLDEGIESRRREVPGVVRLIEDELAVLEDRLCELSVRPLIGELRRRAERIRLEQLEQMLARADDLDAATRSRLDRLTREFVNAMLREPTRTLTRSARESGHGEYVAAIARLLETGAAENDPRRARATKTARHRTGEEDAGS